MAGTITKTEKTISYNSNGRKSAVEMLFSWVGDAANGSVPTLAVTDYAGWVPYEGRTKAGGVAPAVATDITLIDNTDGYDLAGGELVNCYATSPISVVFIDKRVIGSSGFTFAVANNTTNSAVGTARIFLMKI